MARITVSRDHLSRDGRFPGESLHPLLAVRLARGLHVVETTQNPAVLDRRGAATRARDDVVDLHAIGRAADAAAVRRPLAAAPVPGTDPSLHRRRNRCTALLLRGEQRVERRVEDLLGGGPGPGMGLAGPGSLQLLEELLRNGDVQPAQRPGERLHPRPHPFGVGRIQFNRMNWRGRRRRAGWRRQVCGAGGDRPERHDRHHVARRKDFQRPDLQRHRPRLPPRTVKEPRNHVRPGLARDHLRQLEHGREAEAPVPERLEHLREFPHEPCRDLPVMGRAARDAELPVQEVEQAGVAEP